MQDAVAERRLTELEIALTHQQALVDELNGVVAEQAARIDLMARQIERLALRLAEAAADADAGGAPPADARPPHW